MNRNGRHVIGAGVVAACAFLVGCQDADVAGPTGDSVSASEAAAISGFMVSNAFTGWDFGEAGGGGGGAALRSGEPVDIDYSFQVSNACPLGGDVSVDGSIEGTIDDQTGSGDLSLSVAAAASSCAFLHEDTQFTVSTNPDLVLAGGFSFSGGQLVGDATFTYNGSVQWSADDGRSGSCTYDVSVTASESGSLVESGTVCGHSL